MKRYFLLGLAAFGLIALAPTESKADDGFRVYVSPGYQQVRPINMAMTATATIVTRKNIAGTDGTARIIGTITIAIMTEIDASRFSLGSQPSLL